MSIDPRNHNWDTQLERGLPDCRVRPFEREKYRVPRFQSRWDIVFCAQCGRLQACVPPDCPHVFFLCDRCAGVEPPPGTARVPGT